MAKTNNHTGVWPSWERAAGTDAHAAWLCDRFVNRPAVEFYDLKKDPWEMNNLADNPRYAKKIAEMRAELGRWMEEQGDEGASVDVPFNNQIDKHETAVLIKGGWIRDPYIVLAPDGYYYLTGTLPAESDPRDLGNSFDPERGKGHKIGRAHV